MATEGNERNLRYILLLFEGGLLILRAILEKKTKNAGKSLDELLQQQKRILSGKMNKKDLKKLYPQTGNVDTNNWDISLLGTVILQLFKTSISVETSSDIEKLKQLRHDSAHKASISMDEVVYDTARNKIAALLIKLSSGLDRDVQDKCQNFVKQFHTDRIDVSSATERFKEISKFDEKMAELLTTITGQVKVVLAKCDRNHVVMQEIKQMLMELQKKSYKFVQEVGVKMDLRGPNDHLTNLGETTIIKIFKLSLKQNGVEKHFQDLTKEDIQKLTRVVDEILDGIVSNGGEVCDAEKQCIVIKIKCTSYRGLLKLLNYLETGEFKQGLLDIEEMLEEIFKCVYHITFGITQASLGNTLSSLRKRKGGNGKDKPVGSDDDDLEEEKQPSQGIRSGGNRTDMPVGSDDYVPKGTDHELRPQLSPPQRPNVFETNGNKTEESHSGAKGPEDFRKGPISIDVENNALVNDIIELLDSPERKKPEVILLIGKSGAGKSALINTIYKALTCKAHRIAKSGSGVSSTVTTTLNGYVNCGVTQNLIENERLKSVSSKLPLIIDCAGLADEKSEDLRELLELLFGGYVHAKASIPELVKVQKSKGKGALKKRFNKPNPVFEVTKIVIVQGCIDDVPKNLIECLNEVLEICDENCIPKYQCDTFVVITKYDLVKDAKDSHLYGRPKDKSVTSVELEKVEQNLEVVLNYAGTRDVSRMHFISFNDKVGYDNPNIDNIALKFLKRMVEPGVPRVENPTPVLHKRGRFRLLSVGNTMSGIHLPQMLIFVAILITALAVFYILLTQDLSQAKNDTAGNTSAQGNTSG